jgi:hypothetical protein
MNKKYIINDYFFKIDTIVSTQVPIVIIYKLGDNMKIICIFFLVSISKLQQLLLLQFEKTRLFFSIGIITLFLKKNIIWNNTWRCLYTYFITCDNVFLSRNVIMGRFSNKKTKRNKYKKQKRRRTRRHYMRGGWGGPELPFVLGGYDKKHNNFDTNHVVMKGGWVQAAPI